MKKNLKLNLIVILLLAFANKNAVAQENLLGKTKQEILESILKDKKYSIDNVNGFIKQAVDSIGTEYYFFDSLNSCNKIIISPVKYKVKGQSMEHYFWASCNANYSIVGLGKWKTINYGRYVYIYETTDPVYGNCFIWSFN